MPALMLNYFGQGALVLTRPEGGGESVLPARARLAAVAARGRSPPAATVIASQAVISGAFSMTAQAVKLGFLPRMSINYTSETHAGQIYVAVRELAAADPGRRAGGRLRLVDQPRGGVRHRGARRSMAITTLGVLLVARLRWDWPLWRVALVFAAADGDRLGRSSCRTPPRSRTAAGSRSRSACACSSLFTTWKRGRTIVNLELEKTGIELQPFLKSLSIYPPLRVEGTAVFMTQEAGLVPHALLHNLKHNRVLHERVVFLTAIARNVPHVDPEDMARGDRPRRGLLAGGGAARFPGHVRRGRDLRGAGAAPQPGTRRSTSAPSSCRARTSSRAPGRACGAGGSGCSAGCCATRSPRRTSSGSRRTA